MTTTADRQPMSALFKQGHADLHERAESAALPASMASGQIAKETYTRLLRVEYLIHRALDGAIERHRPTEPILADLVVDEHLMAPSYRADLEHFGIDPDGVERTPAVASFETLLAEVEAEDPLLLLALHYVRLGASNGNRYVAKKIRPALGIEEQDSAPGTKHLDPFGKDQRATWDAFKTKLDQAAFTETQCERLVQTARRMFEAVMAVHAEVARAE